MKNKKRRMKKRFLGVNVLVVLICCAIIFLMLACKDGVLTGYIGDVHWSAILKIELTNTGKDG